MEKGLFVSKLIILLGLIALLFIKPMVNMRTNIYLAFHKKKSEKDIKNTKIFFYILFLLIDLFTIGVGIHLYLKYS